MGSYWDTEALLRCIYSQSLILNTSVTSLCRPLYTEYRDGEGAKQHPMGRQCGLHTIIYTSK